MPRDYKDCMRGSIGGCQQLSSSSWGTVRLSSQKQGNVAVSPTAQFIGANSNGYMHARSHGTGVTSQLNKGGKGQSGWYRYRPSTILVRGLPAYSASGTIGWTRDRLLSVTMKSDWAANARGPVLKATLAEFYSETEFKEIV